jgi:hypothetical protein
MSSNVVFDVKSLIRDLEALQPGMKKQLVKDSKDVAKPIASTIKSAIPTVAPLSGMNNNGRVGWGKGKPANAVSIRFRTGRSRVRAVTPLVAIWITSPMTAIADVAGKGGFSKARTVTSEYAYKDGTRKHRVTSQGQVMVRKLRERNLNNFIYPQVEDSLPNAEREVKLVIERYASKVNRKLN